MRGRKRHLKKRAKKVLYGLVNNAEFISFARESLSREMARPSFLDAFIGSGADALIQVR